MTERSGVQVVASSNPATPTFARRKFSTKNMWKFVMKGVAPPGTTFGDIVRAGIPFLICDAATLALVMAFPILALWLPELML